MANSSGAGARLRASIPRTQATLAWGLAAGSYILLVALQPNALSRESINAIFAAAAALILVSAGQTIAALLGEIDLSVGGIVSLISVLAATRMGSSVGSIVFWVVALLALGSAVGALNGLLVTRLGLNSFIATLATWSILSGLALTVLPTDGGEVPDALISWGNSQLMGLATPVWIAVGVSAWWWWFSRTRTGLAMRAVGSDPAAAALAGLATGRMRVLAFVLSGCFASMASLWLITQITSGSPTIGDNYILASVAVVVIGGTSLFGGTGGVSGSIAGALVLTLIGNIVFALNLPPALPPAATGALLIIAVTAGPLVRLYTAHRNARRPTATLSSPAEHKDTTRKVAR